MIFSVGIYAQVGDSYTENPEIIAGEDRSETSFSFDFKTDKDSLEYLLVLREARKDLSLPDSAKTYETELSLKGDKVGKGRAIYFGKKNKSMKIKGLESEKIYQIDVFRKAGDLYKHEITSDSIFTLAEEPKYQANNIMFWDVKKDGMWVMVRKGNGANRIMLMSKAKSPLKGSDPKPPADGTFINPGITGDKDTWQYIGNDTWVVYNSLGNPNKQCMLTGLEPATRYWFYCLEYNGIGKAANFKAINGAQNPRLKYTLAAPPKVFPIEEKTKNSFTVKWEEMENVMSYVIDISYDPEFKDKVDIFNELDVETNTEMLIELDEPIQPIYYVRVMAYLRGAQSPWSKTIEVQMR